MRMEVAVRADHELSTDECARGSDEERAQQWLEDGETQSIGQVETIQGTEHSHILILVLCVVLAAPAV